MDVTRPFALLIFITISGDLTLARVCSTPVYVSINTTCFKSMAPMESGDSETTQNSDKSKHSCTLQFYTWTSSQTVEGEMVDAPFKGGQLLSLCSTPLLPPSEWRPTYEFGIIPGSFLYIILNVNLASRLLTNDISMWKWNCRNINGTFYSGCYTMLTNITGQRHLAFEGNTTPFGAYILSSNSSSLFCHPLTSSLNVDNIINEMHLQQLTDSFNTLCKDVTAAPTTASESNATRHVTSVLNSTLSTSVSKEVSNSAITLTNKVNSALPNSYENTTVLNGHNVTNIYSVTQNFPEKNETISSFLKLDIHQLSSYKRTLICATDTRLSADIIGGTIIAIASLVLFIIVLPDLVNVTHFVVKLIKKSINECKQKTMTSLEPT